ncbi:hypothetical protein JCM5350_007993 [Sporobolomyces pararoseus]
MIIDHSQQLSLSDFTYRDTESSLHFPAPLPPLTLGVRTTSEVYLKWDPDIVPVHIEGGSIKVGYGSFSENWLEIKFSQGSYPPVCNGKLAFEGILPYIASAYTVKIAINVSEQAVDIFGSRHDESFVASILTQKFPDVCLHFPKTGRRLWINREILSKLSPYFKGLFSSGFSEVERVTTIRGASTETEEEDGLQATSIQYEFEDSDSETDETTKPLFPNTEPAADPSYATVTIHQHAYETYLSVLCWVGTRKITFAPLRSRFFYPEPQSSEPEPEVVISRIDHIIDSFPRSPRPPVPVSPKSVYRLAHYLELDGDLSALALSNFESQLSAENVMYELYSGIARKYPEIRDNAIRFTVKHWEEVVETQAFKDVMTRGEDGGEGIDGATGLILSQKLMERK